VAWPDPHPAMPTAGASGTPDLHPVTPTAGASGIPDRTNLYLVPFETIVRTSQEQREVSRKLALAMVRVSGAGSCFDLIAKTAAPLERATIEPPTIDGGLRLDHFDFAPYRLNEQETAFGLRSYFYTMYIGGSGHDEVLELFRVKDGMIEPVLWTWMASSNLVKGEQRGDPKGAVIRVLPTKTKGMFDLKKSARGGRSAIYRWNGQRYETHDPEPMKCFNEPCQNIVRDRSSQD
jgi:hypothetical protein